MMKPYQLLITPITIWLGYYQGFVLGEFIAGWVACPPYYGVDQISFILITYAVCDSLSSICFGFLAKYTGQIIIQFIAIISVVPPILQLITTTDDTPFQDYPIILFIIAGFLGVANAAWRILVIGNFTNFWKKDQKAF